MLYCLRSSFMLFILWQKKQLLTVFLTKVSLGKSYRPNSRQYNPIQRRTEEVKEPFLMGFFLQEEDDLFLIFSKLLPRFHISAHHHRSCRSGATRKITQTKQNFGIFDIEIFGHATILESYVFLICILFN